MLPNSHVLAGERLANVPEDPPGVKTETVPSDGSLHRGTESWTYEYLSEETGGKRIGAGRKPGSVNWVTLAAKEAMAATGETTPLD